jgi:adenylate kinase family enzyme
MRLGDTMGNQCIVVTGLPGSGKSTIGRKIADALKFDFLDKDDYLAKLFQDRGTGDSNWRQNLSRESDMQFQRDAVISKSVVLVSHWRPIRKDSQSGTPAEWLNQQFSNVVELYCTCSVEEATKRFINRSRHPGHLDSQRSTKEILEWMTNYQQALPLSLGTFESIETDSDVQLNKIIDRLSKHVHIDA